MAGGPPQTVGISVGVGVSVGAGVGVIVEVGVMEAVGVKVGGPIARNASQPNTNGRSIMPTSRIIPRKR